MATRRKPASNGGPISVVLPESLKVRLFDEARRRGLGLSPTVRVLVVERLAEMDEAADLGRAEQWQRAQAWASWERLRDGEAAEVSRSALEAAFDRALGATGRRTRRVAR